MTCLATSLVLMAALTIPAAPMYALKNLEEQYHLSDVALEDGFGEVQVVDVDNDPRPAMEVEDKEVVLQTEKRFILTLIPGGQSSYSRSDEQCAALWKGVKKDFMFVVKDLTFKSAIGWLLPRINSNMSIDVCTKVIGDFIAKLAHDTNLDAVSGSLCEAAVPCNKRGL